VSATRWIIPSFVVLCGLAFAAPQVGIEKGPIPDFGASAERERAFDLEHLRIELDLDIPNERFKGVVAEKLIPLRAALESVELDAVDMRIDNVTVSGGKCRYEHGGGKLRIDLPRIFKVGESVEVVIEYSGENPKRGLYFVHADPSDPSRVDQAWTQGQAEDNRCWVPIYDSPNERTSFEITLTVDAPLDAVSNGVLVSTKDVGNGRRRFHWKMEQPNAPYLMAFAVGPWEKYSDRLRDIPVDYYVAKGVGEERARRSFGDTPAMLEFFEKITSTPYPWPQYAQVAVTDFVAGGMENVSCTIQSDRTLHDAAEHLERDSRGLVAHEAAHQWFGDLVTCRTWKDLWLNEGFATYYEALHAEHVYGADEFRMEMRGNQLSWQRSEGTTPRPMVADFYSRVDERANHFVYVKGSSVLHMLRFVLGDDAYQRSIAHYLTKHRMGLVESHDLEIAIAEATGKRLEWFFEQWVKLAGWPKFEVKWEWDDEHKQGGLVVKQTQEVKGLVPLFRTPVDVEFVVDGRSDVRRIFISETEQRFDFKLSHRPTRVRFDKGGWIAKELKFEKSLEEWIDIASNDDDVIGRMEAVIALKEMKDAAATACLAARLAAPKEHREVKRAAAEALAERGGDVARAALIAGLDDADARVRREAARFLAKLKPDADAAAKLRTVVASDPAYGPRENALGTLREWKDGEVAALAKTLLQTPSEDGRLALAGVDALLEVDRASAIPYLMETAAKGVPIELRHGALRALGRAKLEGEARTAAIDLALATLESGSSRTQRAAIDALSALGAEAALPKLDALAKDSASDRLKQQAEGAAKSIRDKLAKESEAAKLRREVDELKARLDKVGAK
jgi:aminopeptidase N